VNGYSCQINGGTFYKLRVVSYTVNLNGGYYTAIEGYASITVTPSIIESFLPTTLSAYTGFLMIILTANDTGVNPLYVGSYTNRGTLQIVGAFSMNRPIIIYSDANSYTYCTNTTFNGLLTFLPTSTGFKGSFYSIINGTYSPTVTVPITTISGGGYRIDETNMPANCGFGIIGGTFSPTIKLPKSALVTNNIGGILE
jgi:hypothetical protein